MTKTLLPLIVLFFIVSIDLQAQVLQVSTLIPEIDASGGMTRDAAGNFYLSDFGPGGGVIDSSTIVYKINRNDFSVSIFAEGFIGASGACFDSQGNFYQSNNAGNRVSKIHADGTIELDWATEGFNLPIGVIADSNDNIYVCNCAGNNVSKITPDGTISSFASSPLFNCPNGLTIDPDGNFYVCNFSDGKILKITSEGMVSELAELPVLTGGPSLVGNGHLTYSNGYLFVALIGSGQIYRLCPTGEAEVIAGQPFGFSNNDGPALQATFSKPNGIVASVTGDTLFVNGSEGTWPTNPSQLHPANVRMITGVNSLPGDLCEEPVGPPLFSQITEGIIVETLTLSMGSSWGDFDNDGDMDVLVTVGNNNNRLYKNNGDLTFNLVGGIVSNDGGSSGASIWGDYDNDGNLDLYISNNPTPPSPAEPNFLYHNDGPPNYSFTKINMDAPVADSNYTWSSSWVDYDNDGDLDLHVPENRHLSTDLFFENNGSPDGNGHYFTKIQPSFVTDVVESTGVASWMDYDNDCDQDIFMIKSGRSHPNGVEDNRIYHNSLQETGFLDFQQVTTAEMVNHLDLDFQASWGDYDNDGDMDVYLGNFDGPNYLYRNEGDSLFTRILEGNPVEDNSATLGSTWGDFDNDGDLDLFVSNTAAQPSAYYENDGHGNFTKLGINDVGPPVANLSNTQSCSNADINNDGYLDLFLANAAISPTQLARDYLYLNNAGTNGFLLLTLKGTDSNKAAIGAKVRIKTTVAGEERWQMRVVSGNPTGDRAQNSLRVHFGLGEAEMIDTLIIEWPSCQKSTFVDVLPNQICEITEGDTTTCQLTTSSRETSLPGLMAFDIRPNPAKGGVITVQYEIKDAKLLTISIREVNGRLIKNYSTPNVGQLEMEVEGLSAGIYVVVLQTSKGAVSRKVMILP